MATANSSRAAAASCRKRKSSASAARASGNQGAGLMDSLRHERDVVLQTPVTSRGRFDRE
jgi:hypothetical protein